MDEQERNTMKTSFKALDVSGSGRIERSKVTSMLAKLLPHWDSKDLSFLIDASGVDDEGWLDYCKFIDSLFATNHISITQLGLSAKTLWELSRTERLELLFRELDVQKRGTLQCSELSRFVKKLALTDCCEEFGLDAYDSVRQEFGRNAEPGLDSKGFVNMVSKEGSQYFLDNEVLHEILIELIQGTFDCVQVENCVQAESPKPSPSKTKPLTCFSWCA